MKVDTGSAILLTGSIPIEDTYAVNTSDADIQLGREDDYDGGISNPNLWEQGW